MEQNGYGIGSAQFIWNLLNTLVILIPVCTPKLLATGKPPPHPQTVKKEDICPNI